MFRKKAPNYICVEEKNNKYDALEGLRTHADGSPNARVCQLLHAASGNKNRIRCTFWFNAGSRIIENKFRRCFFLFLALAGSFNPAEEHYTSPFPNHAGHT